MADVNEAVQAVLREEDSTLSGAVTTIPGDTGGATRFGVAEESHPELAPEGYFGATAATPEMTTAQAEQVAEQVYAAEYAGPMDVSGINDQQVANAVLSFAVNEGPHEATRSLQRALCASGEAVAVDGQMGPSTLAAVNRAAPGTLLTAVAEQQRNFYRNLVSARPALMPEFQGFLNRIFEATGVKWTS